MNEATSVVYALRCLCHDEGYRYVGKTIHGLHDRLICHRYEARRNTTRPLYKWMRKHSPDNIAAVVLEHCPTNAALCTRETHWIAELGTHVSTGGLNVTMGGEGSLGVTACVGEHNPSAKLSRDIVEAIRSDLCAGVPKRRILRMYGIASGTYDNIRSSSGWKSPAWTAQRLTLRHGNAKLTYEQVLEIKVKLRAGATQRSLVTEYNSSRNAINAIAKGRTWQHVPWPT